ncbi:MAG: glycosyltransferase family 4 protein [Cyanobacteria bacterium J06554_6]
MHALILAEDCNPDWPSLPVVGYKYAKALSEHIDVTVVTQIRNRQNIEREGLGQAKVVYIDTEVVAGPLHKLAIALRGGQDVSWTLQMAMNYPSYLFFEWKVWQRYKADLQQGKYDVVHRITPMTPTLPSPMAAWSPVPFVLGPLNGNLPWPSCYTSRQKSEREWMSHLRFGYKHLPYHASTYEQSDCILAAFDHTLSDLPKFTQPATINYPEVGIDPELFHLPERETKERLTILYAGRLVPYKLPDVAVRAFANSPALQKHRLQIVGDGPERSALEQLIAEHGLEHCVELVGRTNQARVGELMRQADIFAFPSIRELGAGVVVEAMACGMACVVVDYGGPATLIDETRGVKVPMAPLGELVVSFQSALESLAAAPERVRQLGQTAHKHALHHYSWDAKARKTLEIYDWVSGKRDAKPDFWS